MLTLLYAAISKQQNAYPEGVFIVAGDFNQTNHRSVLPRTHQDVTCPTRGKNTLEHVNTNVDNAYKTVSCPHLGQSDYLSLLLLLAYCRLITPANRVKTLSYSTVSQLQGLEARTRASLRTLV